MTVRQSSKSLPEFFRPLFWSYDFGKLDVEGDKPRIVINTINYGKWLHWQWLAKTYGREEVRRVIEDTPASEFRERALHLAALLLGINKKFKRVSRSTQK